MVASGLDNPRGIDLRPGGALLVAEAGGEGRVPVKPDPKVTRASGSAAPSRGVTRSAWARLVGDLPSVAAPDGSGALGPHDLAKDEGTVFATIGLGGDEAFRDGFGPGAEMLGTLVRWSRSVACT